MNYFFKIIIIFSFFSCNSDLKAKHSLINREADKFIGEWISLPRVYPFGASLIIKSDSTFNYSFGACNQHGISFGSWSIIDSTIILNSNKPDSTLYLVPFDFRGVDVIDSLIKIGKNDFPIIQEKALDTDNQFIEFKNDSLYIKRDTLFHVSRFLNLDEIFRNKFIKK